VTALVFTYDQAPGRTLFGRGRIAALGAEAERLGLRRVMIVSSPRATALAAQASQALGRRAAGVHARAVMHVPADVAADAVKAARAMSADAVLAVGGGSPIGLAKAVALETGLPVLALPTTFAGSEMTPIWGLTENGVKRTGRDARVLPKLVIYDPDLAADLPANVAGPSGMNAMAHAAEALYAENANPVTSLMAMEAVRALKKNLPRVVSSANTDGPALDGTLYGAWLAGQCLGAVGMALHHKLCHVLGGTFDLPHAQTHTIVLPHVIAYNMAAAPVAMAQLSTALGADHPARALYDLTRSIGAPVALGEVGLRSGDIGRAADLAVANPYYNPAPVMRNGIVALLQAAHEGRRP